MNRPLPAVQSIPLAQVPAAYPRLRFAVRTADGRQQGHDAGARHPLSGTGKLVLACAVARLAGRDAELLGQRLTLTDRHRAGARAGTLRLMSGELSLTVEDAMALIVGTGEAMGVLAVLELLDDRGIDVAAEARDLVAERGLQDTEITGPETADGTSWGEGLTGWTTSADLCTLLSDLPGPVLRWMGAAFEPAGLASGLPGFGPRTVPHQTVAGGGRPTGADGSGDDVGAGSPRGWASVLVLPGAVVAAFLPAEPPAGPDSDDAADGTALTPLQASSALGSLGLSAWRDLSA